MSVSQSSGGDVGKKRAVVAKYGDVSDLYVSRSNLSNLCDTTIVLRSPIMNVRNVMARPSVSLSVARVHPG